MRYVLGVLGFIFLSVIAVVLLNSATANRSSTKQGESVVELTEYIDSGTVSFTTRGEVVGDEDYRSTRITISPTSRRAQVLKGYNETIERDQSFANNSAAFDAFMRSLDNAGFTSARKVTVDDVRGVCPTGRSYIYILEDEAKEVTNLWSTSCSTKQGDFAGNDSLVQTLFENQIPEFDDFLQDVRL